MRILLVHNRYQQRGGEDVVFDTERALLEQAGHEVSVYERDNHEIETYSRLKLFDLARRTIWATDSASALKDTLTRHRPDVAYFFNTFPLISPAAYHVCASSGVPVIQTLANYRLICPGGNLSRDGENCELCVSKTIAWPGIWHKCYRNSLMGSSVVAAMLAFHALAKTWDLRINTYIALTEFSRTKLIAGGLPGEKIVVKPNFVYPDPGQRTGASDYALFVGRLSQEKGISSLLEAWERLPHIPLIIAGDGPMREEVEVASDRGRGAGIQPLGWRSRKDVISLIKGARFLIVPSTCYEGFPLSIVEAFSCGVPVIGSRRGGIGEIVREERSGLLFQSSDPADLAATADRLWSDPDLCDELGNGARAQFLELYTAEKNYELLMQIFQNALES